MQVPFLLLNLSPTNPEQSPSFFGLPSLSVYGGQREKKHYPEIRDTNTHIQLL